MNQQPSIKMYFWNWEIKCMGNGKGTKFNQPANETFQIYNLMLFKYTNRLNTGNTRQLHPSLPGDKTE